jgi:hypothetical protein
MKGVANVSTQACPEREEEVFRCEFCSYVIFSSLSPQNNKSKSKTQQAKTTKDITITIFLSPLLCFSGFPVLFCMFPIARTTIATPTTTTTTN